MLTVHTENPLPAKVMQAGRQAISVKAAPQEVVNAIRCVASGSVILPPILPANGVKSD
jgi:two-component system invasion response regulator UvrY